MGKFVIIESPDVNDTMQRVSKLLGIENAPRPNTYFTSFVTFINWVAKQYGHANLAPDSVILKSFIDDLAAPSCYIFYNAKRTRPSVPALANLWVSEIICFNSKGVPKVMYTRPVDIDPAFAAEVCDGIVALIRKLKKDPKITLRTAYKAIQEAFEAANKTGE